MDQHLSKAKLTLRLLITNTTLYTLATLAVGLQFYTRSRIIRKIVAGDWWILGAWVRVHLSSLDQKFWKEVIYWSDSSVAKRCLPLNLPFVVIVSLFLVLSRPLLMTESRWHVSKCSAYLEHQAQGTRNNSSRYCPLSSHFTSNTSPKCRCAGW